MANKPVNYDKKIVALTKTVNELRDREKMLNATISELRASEKKYRTIFENTGTISLIFDQDRIINMVNTDFAKRMGYSKEEVEGKMSWTEFVAPEDVERLIKAHAIRSKKPSSAPHTQEFKVINRYGETLNIFMTIDMIPGTTLRIASLMDITDKIRAEEELLRISERERQKIGQDLHDDLAPHLMGIEFLSKILLEKIEKKSSEDAALIRKMRNLIQDAVVKTKRFARGLCPVFLADHGLVSSLKELAMSTEEIYATACSFSYHGPVINHDILVSTHLFHIAHEAVHNAVKHGRARNIFIEVHFNNGTLMSVRDDGRGFNIDKASHGMGLKIMKYRSRMIMGELNIKSGKGAGTEITVALPAHK